MAETIRPPFPWPLLRFWVLRTLPVWAAIALVVFLFQFAISGIIHDNEKLKLMLQMLDMWPSFIKAMLCGEWLMSGNIAAFIAIGFQHPLVLLLFMLYAVGTPTALLAGESERGTMELILSRCATKGQIYLCAAGITIVGMFGLLLVTFLGAATATSVYTFDQEIPLFQFFQVAVSGGTLAGTVGAIALLAAASFQTRKAALAASIAFLVTNYFVSIISGYWPRMAFLYKFTIFNYTGGEDIFARQQWPLHEMGIMAALLIVAAVMGGILWQRRDLHC